MGSGNQAADTVVQTTGQTTQRSGQHTERDWIFNLGAREGWGLRSHKESQLVGFLSPTGTTDFPLVTTAQKLRI